MAGSDPANASRPEIKRIAGREYAQRRDRAVDLPCLRSDIPGSFSLATKVLMPVLAAAGGGLVADYVIARLYLVASAFVRDPANSTVLQFVGTFGVWLLFERLGLSPIITVVSYAMTLAQSAQQERSQHILTAAAATPLRSNMPNHAAALTY
jgi:NhaP-type Na+/H+ or K+/H+ antiporter